MLQSKKDEISKGGPAPTTQGRLLDKKNPDKYQEDLNIQFQIRSDD